MRIELTPEQAAFREVAADFAERSVRPRAAELDAADRFPAALAAEAAGLGLLGATAPASDGGAGRDSVAYVLALEAVATASAAVAMILAVHNSLVTDVVARFGDAAQRSQWLRRLASGASLGACALTHAAGPDAGGFVEAGGGVGAEGGAQSGGGEDATGAEAGGGAEAGAGMHVEGGPASGGRADAGGAADAGDAESGGGAESGGRAAAVAAPTGGAAAGDVSAVRDGDGYVLRGRREWVANAAAADVFLILAVTQTDRGGRSVSAFLVPGDAPGLVRQAARDALGVRGLGCGDVVLEDVRVGADALLVRPGGGGDVYAWALDGARVATGAVAVGIGQAAFAEVLACAGRERAGRARTVGTVPGRTQSVRATLADTATDLDAARLLVLKAAAARDRQERCTLEAAMAKLAAAEAARRAADRALRLLAAAAYERGSTAERLLRDARAAEIGQGTSAVQRMTIAAELLGEAPGPTARAPA